MFGVRLVVMIRIGRVLSLVLLGSGGSGCSILLSLPASLEGNDFAVEAYMFRLDLQIESLRKNSDDHFLSIEGAHSHCFGLFGVALGAYACPDATSYAMPMLEVFDPARTSFETVFADTKTPCDVASLFP